MTETEPSLVLKNINRLLLVALATLLVLAIVIVFISNIHIFAYESQSPARYLQPFKLEYFEEQIPEPDIPELDLAQQKADQKKRERQEKIDTATKFLSARNSPMTRYASVIVDAAKDCGGDYKILLAIAEVESGSGRQPYKKYNPYGYLNGVQYSGWESALRSLSCRISQQYISVYGTNFKAMGSIYAGDPNWPNKISKVYYSI